MDFKRRVRDAFVRSGQSLDDDVLEELAEHAESVFQTCQGAGLTQEASWAEVDREIRGWVDEAPRRDRRRQRAPITPEATLERRMCEGLGREIAYAVRVLMREPSPVLVSIATISLGITALTLMASVYRGVLQPLPWPDSERLVRIYESRQGGTSRFGQFGPIVTNVTYLAWQHRPQTIEAVGGWSSREATLRGGGPAARLQRAAVTPSLFGVLQARALLGGVFESADTPPGAAPVVLISYGLWQERFGGQRDVIGRVLTFDDEPRTIVGVMGTAFAFPTPETRAWVPMHVPQLIEKGSQNGHIAMFSAIARLKREATPAQAAAEASARANAAPKVGVVGMAVFGGGGPAEVAVVPALDDATKEVRPALTVLLLAAGLLLLAAAANVANVQLARAVVRRRELAIRSALGATSSLLMRQLIIESMLVGAAGGILGLVMAVLLHQALPALLPPDFPRLADIQMTGYAGLLAVAASIGAGLAVGLLPAWYARRTSVTELMAENGFAPVGVGLRARVGRLRIIPMAAQVTVATVLLVGASLLGRSFLALLEVDRGFQTAHVLTAEVPFPNGTTLARRSEVLESAIERLRALPGVAQAGYTSILPLTDSESMRAFKMPDRRGSSAPRTTVRTALRVVSPGYLPALGLRIVAGRGFTDSDSGSSRRVALVNQAFARTYLGDSPLGAVLPADHDGAPDLAIVGIVNDVRADGVTSEPEMFVPARQYPDVPGGNPVLAIGAFGDPADLAPVVRAVVAEIDATLALGSVMSMEDRLRDRLARPRLYSVVLVAFACLTLAVAAVGLFGVLSYSVTQRSRELAVRAALGASPARILGMVLAEGLGIAAGGVLTGFLVALLLAHSIQTLLFGVTMHDPFTYIGVALVLVATSIVACAVPALRAARLDPIGVLRRS